MVWIGGLGYEPLVLRGQMGFPPPPPATNHTKIRLFGSALKGKGHQIGTYHFEHFSQSC